MDVGEFGHHPLNDNFAQAPCRVLSWSDGTFTTVRSLAADKILANINAAAEKIDLFQLYSPPVFNTSFHQDEWTSSGRRYFIKGEAHFMKIVKTFKLRATNKCHNEKDILRFKRYVQAQAKLKPQGKFGKAWAVYVREQMVAKLKGA